MFATSVAFISDVLCHTFLSRCNFGSNPEQVNPTPSVFKTSEAMPPKHGFKKLHNNSIAKKLNKVGGELLLAEENELMTHITKHLKEHPEQKAVVWRLLQSNLVSELMTSEGEKVPPCSTKLGKLSKHLRKRFLTIVSGGALDATMLKGLIDHDPDIIDTLFFYMLQEDPSTKVAERLVDDLFEVLKARSMVVGNPSTFIKISGNKVNWDICGVYHLIDWVDEANNEVKEPNYNSRATSIVHLFSGEKVS